MRRTKILATIGPASEDPAVLRDMIRAGLNCVRCNFSHGSHEDHQKRIELVRSVAAAEGKIVGILADLQGPKIRVARFKNKSIELKEGAKFYLDSSLDKDSGDETEVGIDYKDLPKDVAPGDTLLLDDGKIVLKVVKTNGIRVETEVIDGGKLSNNKGINKMGGGLTAPALTDKDKDDIRFLAKLNVDYVAVSFPRDANDMLEARALLNQVNCHASLIAKIERTEATENLIEIIEASEGVMVARGDLAVEIGEEYVPSMQKKIIQHARTLDKIVITATQMMESMIESPTPTRAEVSDVVNAILDGTDAIMLSAESATGKYPVKVIKEMNKIALAAEKDPITRISKHRVECHFHRIDEAIAMSAMYAANHMNVRAIIAMTESGSTPLWMSRIRSPLPIYALTPNPATMGKMTLCLGVEPIAFSSKDHIAETVNTEAIKVLLKKDLIKQGDLILITCGDHVGLHGGTNQIKIVKV